jgi:hypothetical protein
MCGKEGSLNLVVALVVIDAVLTYGGGNACRGYRVQIGFQRNVRVNIYLDRQS